MAVFFGHGGIRQRRGFRVVLVGRPKGQITQVWGVNFLGQRFSPTLPKHFSGVVLYDAQHVHVQLADHVDAAPGVQAGQILGSAHHHKAVHGEGLHDGEGRIRGARRQVDHQVVQFPPIGGLKELVDGVVDHGTPPDYGLLLILLKKAHGNHFDAPFLRREYLTVHVAGFFRHTQHLAGVGTVYIHVQQANPFALFRQGYGQVDGHGGLAHAAFAAIDADLGPDLG